MGLAMGLFTLFSAAAFAPVTTSPAPPQDAASVAAACSGPDNWAARSALVQLQNAKLLHRGSIDPGRTKVTLLATEQHGDTYRLVHHIQFGDKNGKTWSVIARSDAHASECSLGDVDLWLVDRQLAPTQSAAR